MEVVGTALQTTSCFQRVVLRQLKLSCYRNYQSLDLQLTGQNVVLWGQNGAGKTNLLEAISLLSPGRGLRRATYANLHGQFVGQTAAVATQPVPPFSVYATLHSSSYGEIAIGTGRAMGDSGRKVRINGATASFDAMSEYCRVIWLVPLMDGLFTGLPGDRRRFLDRMVLAVDPEHARRVMDYDKAMRARNRLLHEESTDSQFFAAIETQLAELGTAIAAARCELVGLLRQMMDHLPDDYSFPKADMHLEGYLEQMFPEMTALDIEDAFKHHLARSRSLDRTAGRTLEGPHRSDFLVSHRPKAMRAALCSTGEQKALLTGLVLSHARLTAEISGMTPVLLLDEMAAHLDSARRCALFDILDELGAQAIMTGTDRALFDAVEGRAQFFEVNNGKVF